MDLADGGGALEFDGDAQPDLHDKVSLRILATTDMHMHVLPYNYLADRPCNRVGLARTASLIEILRAEDPDAILLDNGDFLQGTALGDFIAENGSRDAPHPAIAAMNALKYDAVTLGNHDFNYGVGFLRRVLSRAEFPVTVANARIRRGPAVQPWVIIDRDLADQDGHIHRVKIGVIGFVPPQTAEWDEAAADDLTCDDILKTAAREVPRLRRAGVDLVIALAHSGIGVEDPAPGSDNVATALARMPGIDVIVAGHTHQVFPGPSVPATAAIDPERGALHGKPAVMAGFGGSHLGVIDLNLTRDREGRAGYGAWRVADFDVRAEPVPDAAPALSHVTRPALPLHRAALRHYRRRIGRTHQHLHSFFSLIGEDLGLRLVAMSQRWHVRRELRGTAWEGLPILSAAAPFRAGGRGGPDHYTDVPAGALTLRNLADLYFFPNRIRAVEINGVELADWLERSASMFHQVQPGSSDAQLIDPAFPCYNFDIVDGATWAIDLSMPPRYSPLGTLINPQSRRVRDLEHRGRPVAPDDRFVLATNSYRLVACGMFGDAASTERPLIVDGQTLTRDVLRDYIRRRRSPIIETGAHWRFCPLPGASALFETSPEALPHLSGLGEQLEQRVQFVEISDEGFAVMRLLL